MKKILAVIAAVCLCISFVSCNKGREEEMSTNPDVKQDIANKNKELKNPEEEVPSVSVPENTKKDSEGEDKKVKDTPDEKTDAESTENKTAEENKSDSAEKEQTAEVETITPPSPEEFFPTVAKEFVYENGNTKTVLKMQKDGSFTGVQTVTDSSKTGSGYSNGTKTECHFTGKFTMALPLDEYTYISVLEDYKVNNPSGDSTVKDNTKYVYTESGGLSGMKEVVFYMTGAPTKAISDDFIKCMPGNENFGDKLPDNLYGIFDMNSKAAFHSEN